MLTGYDSYKVEIKEESFLTDDGRSCPRTAIIRFFDKEGEETGSELFGAIDIPVIYKMIEEGRDLNLDNFYINGFSLAAYRKLHNLGRKEPVLLKNLSARNAFFESGVANDFNHALFTEGDISFEGTHFAKGKVLFNGCNFGNGNVNFSNTLFRNGNIDFSGSVFGDGDFIFKNSVIKDGIKDFQDIRFGKGEINFANTEFNSGELLFINTHFGNGNFSFKVARIAGGKVDFHYASFGDCDVSFERTEFGNSRVDFRTVDFGSGKLNFNRAVFGNGEVSFEGASCRSGKIQFKKVVMGSGSKNFSLMEMADADINFEKTEFGEGELIFNKSRFRDLNLRSCNLNHYVDLRVSHAHLLDLSDTVVRDILDLEPYDFDVDIDTINITGMRLVGKIYIDWELNRCYEKIVNQNDTTLRQKAEQFRTLKENFSSTGRYSAEDKAYVCFRRLESRAIKQEAVAKNKWSVLWEYPTYAFKWLVFDKIGLYATAPGRVLISVIIIWFLFGLIYYLDELSGLGHTVSSVGNPDNLSLLSQSFYHSVITFFTIGYGDVYPQGLSRIISGFEGFIGVFMMSYFTVAFVRKVLR